MNQHSPWAVRFLAIGALAVVLLASASQRSEARPQYLKQFGETYPDVKEAAVMKCNVCHFGKAKTNRTEYGKALGEALGKKNEKEDEGIVSALKKAEAAKSGTEGKTFGDLLKEGKLPE